MATTRRQPRQRQAIDAHGSTPRTHRRAGRVPRLILAGLGAQLVGVAVQAAFHMAGAGTLPLLTESRTSLIDHVVSNLGVACLAWQSGRWIATRSAWAVPARRAIVVGTGVQVAGAVGDAAGHLAGGEQPVAMAAIGIGYLLVVGGAVSIGRVRPNR